MGMSGYSEIAGFSIKKVMLLIISLMFLLGASPISQQRNEDEIAPLIDEVLSFFPDIKASVIDLDSGIVTINKGMNDGIKKGMRLTATQKRALRHPVTQEVVGEADVLSGVIEVIEVSMEVSKGEVIEGNVVKGSTLLIPPRRMKVFFIDNGVDYIISDDYLRILRNTGRFDIVQSEDEADIIITLSFDKDKGLLTESVSWSDAKVTFIEKSVDLSEDYLDMANKKRSLYEEELRSSGPLLSFRLPGGARFINVDDIDGDSVPDLILGRASSIEVYRTGVNLKGITEMKLKGELTGLYTMSIKDKKLIISPLLVDNEIESLVLELTEGEIRVLSKIKGILRPVDGRLFYQEFSPYEGPVGRVKEIELPEEGINEPSSLRIKGEISYIKSIFDFIFVDKNIFTYDERGYLNLIDMEGRHLWRSETDTGGFENKYKAQSSSPILGATEWHSGERIVSLGSDIYIIQRKPLLKYVSGAGFTSSGIVKLHWNGNEMKYIWTEEIGGTILDFQIYGERLYVLQKPYMGLSLKDIFKGRSPIVTRLYIFKLK